MKRVLLTGASRGIGVAIAGALASRGDHVVLTARSREGLERTAEIVGNAGGSCSIQVCDVASAESRRQLVQAVLEEGPLDALVNNAGVEHPIAVVDQTPEQIDTQLQVNLHGPIHLTRALLPHFIERRHGAIAMVSSMSGKSPTPYNAIYTATKFGLNGFTASLRIELEGTGVHAGVVCPSFVADAGMWNDSGTEPPAMFKEVPLERVARETLAVLDGKAESLVTPTPVRPLLALGQLFPTLDRRMLGWMGVLDTLKARAENHEG